MDDRTGTSSGNRRSKRVSPSASWWTRARLAHRQGDAVGLYALNDGALRSIRPGRGQAHLHRLMHELERLEPTGSWPSWDRVERALAVGGPRGITVVLSDLHERGSEIREAVLR